MTRTRVVVFVALVTLSAAGAAVAEERRLMTSVDVKRSVAAGDQYDHGRLAGHFSALADRYAAAASRHRVSAAHPGNPSRSQAAVQRAHHLRRARAANEGQATLRELAAHYERLSKGMPSQAPPASERFLMGDGALEPTS
ncbi:MAG: hypothetical protein AB7P22_11580, partial [Vicinamibacterales bacterium]